MAKRMAPATLKKAKGLAEKLKGKRGIGNPQALGRWIAKRGARKRGKR